MEIPSIEKSMQVPNLFDYAASELSQDAFICWLIKMNDCVGHELQSASKEFIALLCRIGSDDKNIEAIDIGKLLKPKKYPEKQYPLQQFGLKKYGKMDIFFMAEVRNKSTSKMIETCFIIEDKVHTHPHSEQLKKYVEYIQKIKPNYPIVKVYYKTGYIFDNDNIECKGRNSEFEYGILDYIIINKYLLSIKTNDSIFISYRDYIQRKFFNRYEEGLKAMNEPFWHLRLNNDFIQYEFLKQLSAVCQETIGTKTLVTGVSSGGDPWAHYRFIFLKDVFGEKKDERVWYRIENRKNKVTGKNSYCLSLRQYSDSLDKNQKKEKLERLEKYKEIFKEVTGKSADIIFVKKPQVDRTGSNSSEIGLLFFDDDKNTIQNVLKYLPVIHKDFVTRIRDCNLNCVTAF